MAFTVVSSYGLKHGNVKKRKESVCPDIRPNSTSLLLSTYYEMSFTASLKTLVFNDLFPGLHSVLSGNNNGLGN